MKKVIMNYELLKRDDLIQFDKLFKIRQEYLQERQKEHLRIIEELNSLRENNLNELEAIKSSQKEEF